MPLRREFRLTVRERAQRDARFRAALLTEAVNLLLAAELEAAKAMLRDFVNATITFDGLARATGRPTKSLQRMLGPRGNPTAESLVDILKVLQDAEGLQLTVRAPRRAA